MADPTSTKGSTENTTPSPGTRSRLPDHEIVRIQQERLHPTPTQWDYLHLRGLRDALQTALGHLPEPGGERRALDLYCGSKPYAPLSPIRPIFGYDIDDHFGAADTVGGLPFPYVDGAFLLVLCTQALHLVDDPQAVVSEIERVLAPGGWAVVTVPRIFRRDLSYERKLGAEDLRQLFAGWQDVRIEGIRGPGTGGAYVAGKLAAGLARRWPWLRPALPGVSLVVNGAGAIADWLSRPLWRSHPAALLLAARPPGEAS